MTVGSELLTPLHAGSGPEAEPGSVTIGVPLVRGAPIVDARFVARPNRFVVEAELSGGERVLAHLADRGRLLWLVPGTPLLLGARPEPGRRTGFQVAAAWSQDAWSSLDTHLPNRLVEAALRAGALSQFAGYTTIRREARLGPSRFDFRLDGDDGACYLEVKSVGHAIDEVARFPDAPTLRGSRHLAELGALARSGVRAALVFVAQHATARSVMPDRAIDPRFADALLEATAAGLEVYAYRCPITQDGIELTEALPIIMA